MKTKINTNSVYENASSLESAKFLYEYDSTNGSFTWKNRKGPNARIVLGSTAGHRAKDGYIHIRVCSRLFLAHRVAWALCYGEWPRGMIDHINGERDNNRINNLRVVSPRENSHNMRIHREGAIVGAFYDKTRKLWRSAIVVNGKTVDLGRYKTQEEAHTTHVKALAEYISTGNIVRVRRYRTRESYRNTEGTTGVRQDMDSGTWRSRIYYNRKGIVWGPMPPSKKPLIPMKKH